MSSKLLSICIPSYNRDIELKRLLESIDASGENAEDLEIVIREDKAPKREAVRAVAEEYAEKSNYRVNFIENDSNFGYDKNLRMVAKSAEGKWVVFMGDDDLFIPGSLDDYMDFLREHDDVGYILRRYRTIHKDGSVEESRYSKQDVFFKAGSESIVELFRRSVFISGFTFKKEYFDDYDYDQYDGTLLFQLYILAAICKDHRSCYCDIPISEQIEGGIPFFGKAESEKNLYDSGYNSIRNSLNFMNQVKIISESLDDKLGIDISEDILRSYSKYAYGYLHEHRDEGVSVFNKYASELRKMGFAKTYHFNVYYFTLLVFGKRNTQKIIAGIKKLKGNTPRL